MCMLKSAFAKNMAKINHFWMLVTFDLFCIKADFNRIKVAITMTPQVG